jgi:hypothetical protein
MDLTRLAGMRRIASSRDRRHRLYRALPGVLLAVLPLGRAFAADSSDTYPDGAVGRSQVRAAPVLSGRFKENNPASRVIPGLRSIAIFGANSTVFAPEAGACSVNRPACNLQPFRLGRSDASFSSMTEGQFDLGSWALSARYKQFVEASGPEHLAGLKENHLVLRVMAGPRPLSLLGAEFAHIDLGQASGGPGGFAAITSMRGTVALGVLHLPLPSPVIDVYAKAGLARLTSTSPFTALRHGAGACSPNDPTFGLQPLVLNRIDTSFAGGAGAQFKLGSWALRAEYKQFIAAGGHPGVVSVGFSWDFR